jgi:hypothetical protein
MQQPWCDMMCPHAEWPKDEALDGSKSCRTFIAVYCSKHDQITQKNGVCLDLTQSAPEEKSK